jgi:DNA-binding response OmpR family regulator
MNKILVIDDNLDDLTLAQLALSHAGYDVVATGNPTHGLATALDGEFDGIVLDVEMPDLPGHEVLKRLRSDDRTRGVPILFLSARSEGEDRVRGLRAGADDYLVKPFHGEELIVRVQRLISRAGKSVESLEGNLEEFTLTDVLQTLLVSRKSGFLIVAAPAGLGRLVLSEGHVLSASYGHRVGREALLGMVSEAHGRFRFVAQVTSGFSRADTIDLPSSLLEAAWISDELAQRRDKLPAVDSPLSLLRRDLARPASTLPNLPLEEICARLDERPGTTLGQLAASEEAAPDRLRLAVAFLLELGAIRASPSDRKGS